MARFSIGEEVMYRGERYAITIATPAEPYEYRLVRTTEDGAEVVWALEGELSKIERYTRPRDDTQAIRGTRQRRA
jgi:hypothetical protein